MSDNNKIVKGISKLETIGKKGKLTKIIKITIEHFEYLKSALNEFSLKILAYIIKGFFLAIKKTYESFNKELEDFIEFNINGNNKRMQRKEAKGEKREEKGEFFTIQNLSLYSENNEFEKFLNDTNMTQKISRTLKRINKKFSSVDFSSMSEEVKKEYLKKNFIQPLSDTLPMSSEFFSNSSIEQCISVNENFADYIQFDLKAITSDIKAKSNFDTQINTKNNDSKPPLEEMLNNQSDMEIKDLPLKEFNFEEIVFNSIVPFKNSEFKADSKLEFNIDKFCEKNENTYSDTFKSFRVFQKNFKFIILADNLRKFKHSLHVTERESRLFNDQRDKLILNRFEDTCSNLRSQRLIYEGMEAESKFRGSQLQMAPRMDQFFEELLINTDIRKVFDNKFYNYSPQIDDDANLANEIKFEELENLEMPLDEGTSLVNMDFDSQERIQMARESNKLLNSEIQNMVIKNFEKKKSFEEFKLDQLAKNVRISSLRGNAKKADHLNFCYSENTFRSECTLLFYNMMIVAQTNQLVLRQNKLFEKIYLVKI